MELRALLFEWEAGPFSTLFTSLSLDLSLHAHTLSLNLHRALQAMGDGAVGDASVLQGVPLASPARAVTELTHPRRFHFLKSLALHVASGEGGDGGGKGGLSPGLRWAGMLAQQILCCLGRLCHFGVIGPVEEGEEGGRADATARLFQMSVQSGSCTSSEQARRWGRHMSRGPDRIHTCRPAHFIHVHHHNSHLHFMLAPAHLHNTPAHLHISSAHPHTLTRTHRHILTHSHLHTFTPSHLHTLTHSLCHDFTHSHFTPAHLQIFTPSHPHTLPSHPHAFTHARPHTLTPSHLT